ncbi:MAG: pyridoxine 5'-phosphate synthase [Opitutaceae bacterium]|nr:pyridoxine 5'-phosphate synthase [Opitutaceae bacterium]|tara:strand:+ start:2325 stop:3083 length:759 start_codon:yes stop_codon:yes gene_type:complete
MAEQEILLGINIDHFVTVRQARYKDYESTYGNQVEPDPVAFAHECECAGADSITVHQREDKRHIQPEDVRRLRASIKIPLNLEMAATDSMLEFALSVKPDYACIVPENRQEVTTEGGLNLLEGKESVGKVVKSLSEAGVVVSLFIDPKADQIEMAAELGVPVIELHTGSYANAYYSDGRAPEYERLKTGALLGHDLGLVINAGHGINYENILEVRTLPHLNELNIGHTIVSRALFTGVPEAVREMRRLANGG